MLIPRKYVRIIVILRLQTKKRLTRRREPEIVSSDLAF
ncbi:hypothetical protein TcasGA2_TC033664 [Tribolium castaneum]|uniref:Uncharacterized protein n=1 Tax=Tribolium castaneum TaxID=7070 RepID=A0A139WF27_TRICA|nr:hypothetical protein TcasGA2_TC033664 [Tribolium castaneum]